MAIVCKSPGEIEKKALQRLLGENNIRHGVRRELREREAIWSRMSQAIATKQPVHLLMALNLLGNRGEGMCDLFGNIGFDQELPVLLDDGIVIPIEVRGPSGDRRRGILPSCVFDETSTNLTQLRQSLFVTALHRSHD